MEDLVKYVAYYRVSTLKQNISGLGLEAQMKSVKDFTKGCKNCIIAEFTERENSSGKNDSRVELAKAIEMVKKENATLLIAKLDRLSRKVSFVSALNEAKVKFVCCDNPNATPLTIHILAAVAEDELRRISSRTKDALQAKKARGFKLGSPIGFTKESLLKAIKTKKSKQNDILVIVEAIEDIIAGASYREQDISAEKIAEKMNQKGIKSISNKAFTASNIKTTLRAFKMKIPSVKATNEYRKSENGKNNKENTQLAAIRANELRGNGETLLRIAEILNAENFKTSRGKLYHKQTVKRILEEIELQNI